MNHTKVIIPLLNRNTRQDTTECLGSLEHIAYPNYELLLVDNGSTDEPVECFRERYPGMESVMSREYSRYAQCIIEVPGVER